MNTGNGAKFLMVFVGISGAFSVLFGAWLAHVGLHLSNELQNRLTTALNYQMIHTLALFVCLIWYQRQPRVLILVAAVGFALGILAFSGSLYLKTFFELYSIAKLAPLGGISMALGWLMLAIAGKKYL